METLLMVLGGIVLIPAIFALAVLISMWRAWWLHPLWALVIVPLGVPQISYWHFLALGMFLHGWLAYKASGETEASQEKDWSKMAGSTLIVVLWPVVTYYFVRWYMS